MNKNIKLAVAGAVLALSATAANAGIIIPAGDWTVDINGNVNAFAITNNMKGDNNITGGMATRPDANQRSDTQGINTGLLPAWLGVTGSTRQNDVDTSFTISLQPGASQNNAAGSGSAGVEYRQAFLTFGDKSWGSIKLGKDLGIFASDAILNDMTLLGVGAVSPGGSHPASGTTTTYGGIGSGYIYAAWKGQVAYTTPNFNGFQATVGIVNPNQATGNELYQERFGLEGKASYAITGDALNGKIWVSGGSYKMTYAGVPEFTAAVGDVGANLNAGSFGLTAYYYKGDGVGTTTIGGNNHNAGAKRDSDGGYIQGTVTLPTKTKIGLALATSKLDRAAGETTGLLVKENKRYTVGAYHPLTKHLNLVAEYSRVESEAHNNLSNENNVASVGGILFF